MIGFEIPIIEMTSFYVLSQLLVLVLVIVIPPIAYFDYDYEHRYAEHEHAGRTGRSLGHRCG